MQGSKHSSSPFHVRRDRKYAQRYAADKHCMACSTSETMTAPTGGLRTNFDAQTFDTHNQYRCISHTLHAFFAVNCQLS